MYDLIQCYSQAVESLSQDNLDYKGLAYKLAAKHPDIFCSLVGFDFSKMDEIFTNEGREAKIKLIKIYREMTGATLADAKIFVEKRYSC